MEDVGVGGVSSVHAQTQTVTREYTLVVIY